MTTHQTPEQLDELDAAVRPSKRDPHPCVTRCFRVGGWRFPAGGDRG